MRACAFVRACMRGCVCILSLCTCAYGCAWQWVKDTESRSFEVSGRLLDVTKKGARLQLDINFDNSIITLFKEVRNLQWLGYRVPFTISMLSTGARQVYPFAVSLKEAIRAYTQTCGKVHDGISPLVAAYKKDVQQALSEGFRLKWESVAKLDPYIKKLSDAVAKLQDKVDDLVLKHERIMAEVQALRTCAYTKQAFAAHLSNIQAIVDEFNLAAYSNLEYWVAALDRQLEEILTARLRDALQAWNSLFV